MSPILDYTVCLKLHASWLILGHSSQVIAKDCHKEQLFLALETLADQQNVHSGSSLKYSEG